MTDQWETVSGSSVWVATSSDPLDDIRSYMARAREQDKAAAEHRRLHPYGQTLLPRALTLLCLVEHIGMGERDAIAWADKHAMGLDFCLVDWPAAQRWATPRPQTPDAGEVSP